MRERRHREDAPWPGSVATNCVSCYRRWPCEGFQTEEYIAALEATLTRAHDFVREAWDWADSFTVCEAKEEPGDCDINHIDWQSLAEKLWGALEAIRAGADAELAIVRAFVERVNARAEARMQAGNPLEGSHWMSMQVELKAMESRAGADAGEGRA